MVTEKVNAFAEGAATIAAGGTAHHVVKGYRQKFAPTFSVWGARAVSVLTESEAMPSSRSPTTQAGST
jgi:hypothetical protein